ncbi:single-stranded DNA-binding protein, partial [Campylobacter coli]|nr:single-stranded DNA-binding protein [Campylobacter coli]
HEGKIYSKHRIKAKEIDFRTPKKEKQTIPNIEEGENYEGF